MCTTQINNYHTFSLKKKKEKKLPTDAIEIDIITARSIASKHLPKLFLCIGNLVNIDAQRSNSNRTNTTETILLCDYRIVVNSCTT